MDILTFISNLISAVAWPLAIVIIVFVFKDPLVDLLSNIKRLKYKDAELEFEKAIAGLKEIKPVTDKQIVLDESQLKLAELSPRGAILESWLELEEALACAAEKMGMRKTRPGGLVGNIVHIDSGEFAQKLTASGKLSTISYERFQKLRQIRNKAVHVTDDIINQEDAETFLRLVAEIKLEVKSA